MRLPKASSPEGLAKAGPLVEEVLVLNGKLALAIPATDLVETQELLTQLADTDPQHCVKTFRWRRSTNGGRPWARPSRLTQQVQASTTRAQLPAKPGMQAAEDAASAILVSLAGRRGQAYPLALLTATATRV